MTKIYYRITEADPSDLQISVRFYSDKLTESDLTRDGVCRTEFAVSLPLPIPAGDELHELIMRHCPVDWFGRMHAARDPSIDTGMPHIAVGMVREVVPLPAPAPTEAEIVTTYMAQVQLHMDATARLYGYDGLISVISYADEPAVARYQAEGQAFRAWRSACWFACEQMLATVKAGDRTAPTHQELIAKLPAIDLPDPVALAT